MTTILEIVVKFYRFFHYLSIDDISYVLVKDYLCTLFDPINSFQVDKLKYEPKRSYQKNEAIQIYSMMMPHHFSLSSMINSFTKSNTWICSA
jgi:hypothetical protein